MNKLLIILFIKNFFLCYVFDKNYILESNYIIVIMYLLTKNLNNLNFLLIFFMYICDLLFNDILALNVLCFSISNLIFFNKLQLINNLSKINKCYFLFKYSFLVYFIKLIILYILNIYEIFNIKLIFNIFIHNLIDNLYMIFII